MYRIIPGHVFVFTDLSTSGISIDPIAPQTEIYQDTVTPVSFSLQLTVNGRPLVSDGMGSFIGFDFYLSDQDDITPTAINSATEFLVSWSVEVDEATETVFNGHLLNGETYGAVGVAEVLIPGDACADTSRFLCAKYSIIRDMQPPMRELDDTNDFACSDVSSVLGCHSSMLEIITATIP